jgi:hypothetical protein
MSFLIIDLGASIYYTHHCEQINGFAKLINDLDSKYRIALPIGSQCSLKKNVILSKLLPASQTVEFELARPTSWISALIGKLITISSSSDAAFIYKFISRITFNVLVYVNFRIINQIRGTSKILFPTACPVTLAIVERFELKKIRCQILVRFTHTTETRGYFSDLVDYKNFIDRWSKFKHVNLILGYEMKEFMQSLKNSDFLKHSPHPKVTDKLNTKKQFQFGFFGKMQNRKGLISLLEIIEGLIRLGVPSSDFCVQIPTAHSNLSLSPNLDGVTFFWDNLEIGQLNQYISQTKLVILPYEISTYMKNSSAMVYRCLDLGVPIATFKGSAFAREINDFNIGLIFADVEEAITLLSKCDDEQLAQISSNIDQFNLWRRNSNVDFLNCV